MTLLNTYLPRIGAGGEIILTVINNAADFPTPADVDNGEFYAIGTNVTDNDPSRTNTGQSFSAGNLIFWNASASEYVVSIVDIPVQSVAGKTGIVTLNASDISVDNSSFNVLSGSDSQGVFESADSSLSTALDPLFRSNAYANGISAITTNSTLTEWGYIALNTGTNEITLPDETVTDDIGKKVLIINQSGAATVKNNSGTTIATLSEVDESMTFIAGGANGVLIEHQTETDKGWSNFDLTFESTEISSSTTLTTADFGKIHPVNSSSAAVYITLPSAASAAGMVIGFYTSSFVNEIQVQASELIRPLSTSVKMGSSELIIMGSDGVNWAVINYPYISPNMKSLVAQTSLNSLTEKTSTAAGDLLLLSDSASSYDFKKVQMSTIKDFAGGWANFDLANESTTISSNSTLTTSDMGKIHPVSSFSSSVAITLPSVSDAAGMVVGFYATIATNTISVQAGTIIRPLSTSVNLGASELLILASDGTNWNVVNYLYSSTYMKTVLASSSASAARSNLDAEQTISNLPVSKGGVGINSLSGQANKFLTVKSDETGYELVDNQSGFEFFNSYTPTGLSTFDIGTLPAGINMIRISYQQTSLNVNGYVKIRLGDSSGISTSSYAGSACFHYPNVAAGGATTTDGLYLDYTGAASDVRTGQIDFTRVNGTNNWIMTGIANIENIAVYAITGGRSFGLSSAIETIRIYTTAGTFDSGRFDIYVA